ncbi:A/G-specific adenine glycosylase [Rufibacter tibetensis]|uniref:Adenine DNA glycosylase n=1 Tax=Rufibacter tibetensis TaxID=512763 RepID=A0A0P0C3E7_9BACT|nr:A/G-specific adenine glycosylase [Rufibacter tibetensis]ALI99278.1 A/G-specific adenine glycosylase [Rufibacter tibetensis]
MATNTPTFFSTALIEWYHRHRRPLPWRETTEPYAIWLSEIILQQTRVRQGLPYYLKFIERFPRIHDLANAPEDEVLRLWQGLGYYSRARNLHYTAKQVVSEFGGIFPASYAGLLQLKGVGSYTAAAIASFAYREPVAVLDGNVYRVLARVFGRHENIAAPASKKVFEEIANAHIPTGNPDTFNQAIMEFGAIQCTPVAPDCLFCPLQQECFAFQHGLINVLPVKEKTKSSRQRFFHYFVLQHEGKIYLKKRPGNDIWQGLYDFFTLETDSLFPIPELIQEQVFDALGLPPFPVNSTGKVYKHILSHQKVSAQFYLISLPFRLREETEESIGLQLYSISEIEELPKPILIHSFLDEHFF